MPISVAHNMKLSQTEDDFVLKLENNFSSIYRYIREVYDVDLSKYSYTEDENHNYLLTDYNSNNSDETTPNLEFNENISLYHLLTALQAYWKNN